MSRSTWTLITVVAVVVLIVLVVLLWPRVDMSTQLQSRIE